jgi:hypothetical protein
MYEIFMTRNINDPDTIACGQIQVSETQIDGDSPSFFFLMGIAVDVGQGFY